MMTEARNMISMIGIKIVSSKTTPLPINRLLLKNIPQREEREQGNSVCGSYR